MNHNEIIADADFCMKVLDNSMKNSRIFIGDIIYVKKEIAQNGDMAVVSNGGNAIIGYFYNTARGSVLIPDNTDYEPVFLSEENKILGIAVAFYSTIARKHRIDSGNQSDVRKKVGKSPLSYLTIHGKA